MEQKQELTSVLTWALLIHTHTWDWESPAELRVSGGQEARVCRVWMCCPRVSVSQVWVWSEAVRTLDSSLSLYTSAIAFRGLHHCISCRGGRAQFPTDTLVTTFKPHETLNTRLFVVGYTWCVLKGCIVLKMNDNITLQVLPDSPFYWWYERKVRQLFADKVVTEEAWVRNLTIPICRNGSRSWPVALTIILALFRKKCLGKDFFFYSLWLFNFNWTNSL